MRVNRLLMTKSSLKWLTLGMVFLLSGLQTQAQDPQYSQFYSNLVLLNPAFTGTGIGHRFAMNGRLQWAQIPGSYQQFAFSYDQPVFFLGTTQGLGISFNSDRAGEGNLTKLNVALNYAYQVELSRDHTLRFGLMGGIQQASIDFFKLRFPDQINPRDGFTNPTQEPGAAAGLSSQIRPDIGAGIAYFNPYAWVGATINHITRPTERFYDFPLQQGIDATLPIKISVTGGLKIPLTQSRGRRNSYDRDVSITPAFLFKMQGEFSQIDAGLYLNVEPMVFGAWYRHQDAMIGLIGIKTGNFRFGYSYDYTISDLSQRLSGGSHEVSVVFEFEQARKNRKIKYKDLPCPKF